MKEVEDELVIRKAALLIKAPVLTKEAKALSEETRSGAAGDTKTLEEAQDLGQRKRSSAEGAAVARSEGAETAGETRGIVRQ